jgi:catechol 2,3-dioxygenase-like lactoylglutathione lyase family enzyme
MLLLSSALALTAPVQAEPSSPPAPPVSAPAAKFTWLSLEVRDMEAARRFYVDALGMKQILQLSTLGAPVQKFGFNFSGNPASGEPILILIHYDAPTPEHQGSSGAMVGLVVSDVHVAADQVRKAGYTVLREPPAEARDMILTALVRDPDGVTIEISELRGAGS